MKRLLLGLVVMLSLVTLPVLASPASAHDYYPCGARYHHDGTTVQNCSLWRGNVPVINHNWKTVGHLYSANGNWFVCQAKGGTYRAPGTNLKNNWWAYTLSDNGTWGWVPEVYFKGGNNYEPDGNLRHC